MLPPGAARCSTEYGVARGTLREALRYLESQGVLTIKPGPRGGPVVYLARSALPGEHASRCCCRSRGARIGTVRRGAPS